MSLNILFFPPVYLLLPCTLELPLTLTLAMLCDSDTGKCDSIKDLRSTCVCSRVSVFTMWTYWASWIEEKREIEHSHIALVAPVVVILDELILLKYKQRYIKFLKGLSGHTFEVVSAKLEVSWITSNRGSQEFQERLL